MKHSQPKAEGSHAEITGHVMSRQQLSLETFASGSRNSWTYHQIYLSRCHRSPRSAQHILHTLAQCRASGIWLKSAQITVDQPVWRLNRNQTLRIIHPLECLRLRRVLPVCGAMPAKVIAGLFTVQPWKDKNIPLTLERVYRTRPLLQTTTLTAMHTLVRQRA